MSDLTVRHPRIDIAALDLPTVWVTGDAFRTQAFNALSQSFPIGEQYFIDAVRAALPLIDDAALRDDIRRFIGQEATHSGLHRILNARLTDLGLRNRVEPRVARRIRRMEGLGVRSKLAITMAYEHFTAVLGDTLLRQPDWLDGASEPMRVLWQWHAVEECEHRAVAADAYQALGGGEGRRIGWFLYVSLLFAVDTSVQTIDNLRRSGHLTRMATWAQGLRFLFGRRGLVRAVMPAWFAYLRPAFSPRDRGDDEAARRWLADHTAWFVAQAPTSQGVHRQAPPARA